LVRYEYRERLATFAIQHGLSELFPKYSTGGYYGRTLPRSDLIAQAFANAMLERMLDRTMDDVNW
jgi:hypothetical protein